MIPLRAAALREVLPIDPHLDFEIDRVVFDHREAAPRTLFVGLKGRTFDGGAYAEAALSAGAELVICGPGAIRDPRVLVVPDPKDTLLRLAGFVREHLQIPVIAITGSVGKTTVQSFLTHLLRSCRRTVGPPGSFNNREGVARTIFPVDSKTEILVLELGTNAPGEIAELAKFAKPTAAVLTAIAPVHLEKLRDLDGVLREKTSLIEALPKGAPIFVNGDDPRLSEYAMNSNRVITQVSLDPTRTGARVPSEVAPFRLVDPIGAIELRHGLDQRVQVQNLWLAWVVARHFVPEAGLLAPSLATLQPAAYRGETRRIGSTQVIIDCWNASPVAMRAALSELGSRKGRRIAFLGDMLELGEESETYHREIQSLAIGLGLDELHWIGPIGSRVASDPTLRTHPSAGAAKTAFGEALRAADWILLKGSRGLRLESLLEHLDG